MDLIFLGRQGSGKGTQARILAERFGYTILEMGKECRRIAEEDSELGQLAKSYTGTGRLVPSEVVIKIAADFLGRVMPGQKIIFDGVPRNSGQAKDLCLMLKAQGRDYYLIHFLISEEIAVKRLAGRATCTNKSCAAIYPADYQQTICERCGEKLQKRVDDNDVESVKTRLALFAKETWPVIEDQAVLGKVITIDASKSVDQVTAALLKALVEKGAIDGPV